MELRQLEYALAVADELHFGRAAQRMHVTQQSVSEQVRRLERELGASLFTRTSRRVALTTVGEAFLPEARRAVAAARYALDVGRRAAGGHGGEIRIGYADDVGARLFELAVPRLVEQAPSVRVRPEPMSTPEQIAALADHRLDVVLGWATEGLAAGVPGLTTMPVGRDPLVLAVAAHHPFADLAAVDPARLSHQPLVFVPREGNPALHDHVTSQLVARGVVVTLHQSAVSLDRMLPLVLAGSAVGLAMQGAAAAKPTPGVVYRPFTAPAPSADYGLVWHRGTTNSAVTAFVGIVRELRDGGAFLPPPLP